VACPPRYSPAEIAAGDQLFRKPWRFVCGAPTHEALPAADRPEIALAGRSNVGKSTLLNALAGQLRLARVSHTPGRTQGLNFFATPGVACYLVDMPGYGFAVAPKVRVAAWNRLIEDYLRGRPTLVRVFLLIDARRGLKRVDLSIMRLLDEAAVNYQFVLTKVDKLAERELAAVLASIEAAAARHRAAHPMSLATSAAEGRGIDMLRAEIARLLTETRRSFEKPA